MGITYSECVFKALIVQHPMRMSHINVCGLSSSTIFFHVIIQTNDFRKNSEHKMCVLIFSTTFVWNIFYSKKKERVMVKYKLVFMQQYLLFLTDF
jgi:hypothetical protein